MVLFVDKYVADPPDTYGGGEWVNDKASLLPGSCTSMLQALKLWTSAV